MPAFVLFDVNETLLDLKALDPHFTRVFGTADARREWFEQVLQTAFVSTILHAYVDFGTAGRAALAMTATRRGVTLHEKDSQAILDQMRALPPYPEVPDALRSLKAAGLQLAALTNSSQRVAERQLAFAELDGYFERIFSVEAIRRLKPAPEPYRHAAAQLGVSPRYIRFVAAHAWDIAGALRAGCRAAFVARPGKVLYPLFDQPEIAEADLQGVARRILDLENMPTGSA